jgi:hypothetical protein
MALSKSVPSNGSRPPITVPGGAGDPSPSSEKGSPPPADLFCVPGGDLYRATHKRIEPSRVPSHAQAVSRPNARRPTLRSSCSIRGAPRSLPEFWGAIPRPAHRHRPRARTPFYQSWFKPDRAFRSRRRNKVRISDDLPELGRASATERGRSGGPLFR